MFYQDEWDGTNTQTITEAREDKAGNWQGREAREHEAQTHHHHREGVENEEDDVDNPAVKLGKYKGGHQVTDSDGHLK